MSGKRAIAPVALQAAALDDRHARHCICCLGIRLRQTPAVLMPFLAKRIFGHDPVEITEEWGLRDLRLGMAYSLCNTLECKDCGAVFLDYRFSDHELSLLYSGYRSPEYNEMRERFEPSYAVTAAHYQGRAPYLDAVETFLSPYLPNRPKVLDWGGDSGVNSPFRFKAAPIHVYDVSGAAVCPEAISVSYEQCLINDYDLITCSQVLEHVPQPIQLLKQVSRLLHPKTILYLEVPLEELFRIEKEGIYRGSAKRHWHEHINFFSPTSLKALSKTCGLQILAQEIIQVSLGWRDSMVQALICQASPPEV